MTRTSFAVVFALSLTAPFGAVGQEPRGDAPIRIGAVVTDPRGRPILDLKATDFELKSGGIVQPISAVELRRADASAAAAAPRTFALFLDEFHVSAGAHTERVRSALLQFVDAQLRPGDRVAVMKPLDSQTAIELTSDRTAIRTAVETFAGRAGDYTPRTEFEQKYMGHAPAAVEMARAQIVSAALRALAVRLGQASEGRTAIAFVSEGFAGGRQDRERRLPDDTTIARLSSRFNVAIYTLDPAGNATDADLAARLRKLSADTGGESSFGADQLIAGLRRMASDLDAYYLLTFQPLQRVDGRFQRVELTARRRDAVVRAPSGFWTPFALPASAASELPVAAPPRTLRRSPLIQTWTGLTRLADGRLRMRVTWEPSPQLPASRRPAAVQVRATKSGGDALFDGKVSSASRSADDNSPRLAEFIVSPGRIEIDLSIVAADGSTIDKDLRDIDVPDVRRLRTTSLNPEIVRTRTVREFAALSVDPNAAPTPSREFRRADRLLIRGATLTAAGTRMTLSARLHNRWGQPMRELAVLPFQSDVMVQFDLPLAWLAAGEYEIELIAKDGQTETAHRLSFRVTG